MGGLGSGRHWQHGVKACAEDYQQVDVRRWQREGFLASGRIFQWRWWTPSGKTMVSIEVRTETNQVSLSYRHRSGDADWQHEEYPVRLDWTGCTFGGRRAWFLCPAQGCGRRVAILYVGAIFACRYCYRLAYRSQRVPDYERAMRRGDKIRKRLGWDPGILNAAGDKPKGMRWHTYTRLCVEHAVFAHLLLSKFLEKMGDSTDLGGVNRKAEGRL